VDAAEISDGFALGVPTGPLTYVARGELGRVCRLTTTSGVWAVKEIELFVPTVDEADANVELQESMLNAGVNLPRPRRTADGHALMGNVQRSRISVRPSGTSTRATSTEPERSSITTGTAMARSSASRSRCSLRRASCRPTWSSSTVEGLSTRRERPRRTSGPNSHCGRSSLDPSPHESSKTWSPNRVDTVAQ
jgi:hypothetical protein